MRIDTQKNNQPKLNECPPNLLSYMLGAGMIGVSSTAGASVLYLDYGNVVAETCDFGADECQYINVNLDPSDSDIFGAAALRDVDDELRPGPFSLGLASADKGESCGPKEACFVALGVAGKGVDLSYGLKSQSYGPDNTWLGKSGEADRPIPILLLGELDLGGDKGDSFTFAGENLTLGYRILNEDNSFNYGWLRYSIGPISVLDLALETEADTPIGKPVPAPATLVLMVAGLGGLAAARRRRKLAA